MSSRPAVLALDFPLAFDLVSSSGAAEVTTIPRPSTSIFKTLVISYTLGALKSTYLSRRIIIQQMKSRLLTRSQNIRHFNELTRSRKSRVTQVQRPAVAYFDGVGLPMRLGGESRPFHDIHVMLFY